MHPPGTLRETLELVKKGLLSIEEAEMEIIGLRLEKVGEMALLDMGRTTRCGMPEIVLAEGKNPQVLGAIAVQLAAKSGRCLISRVNEEQVEALTSIARTEGLQMEYVMSAGIILLSNGTQRPPPRGNIAVLTAGTADIRVAEEARVMAEEMGCTVQTAYDVGVAGIHRLFSALKGMREATVFIVVAGREGTLPSIVAGLVDRPVIGVPVSSGYGYMGKGEAALASMLQSCALLTVVNIDAGVVAGACAARIARMMEGS